jgi:hypothetical protein
LLRSTQNILHSQLSQPITLQTSKDFNCRTGGSDIAKFNASSIIIHRDVYMDDCQTRKLQDPNADDDAATKRYVDPSISDV